MPASSESENEESTSDEEEEELEESDPEVEYFGIGIQAGKPAPELLEETPRREEIRSQLRRANILELEEILCRISERLVRIQSPQIFELWRAVLRAQQLAEQLRIAILRLDQESQSQNGRTN